MDELFKKLIAIDTSNDYPFHMPGHKRFGINGALESAYKMDITEIPGMDDLADAQGVILQEETFAQELFKVEKSYFLVNGSTCGILSALFSVGKKGDTIIMARNAHKSAYHAVTLRDYHVKYIYPKSTIWGGISGCIDLVALQDLVNNTSNIKAVFITSPTYEGIISDVASICKIAHEKNIPVIVDEAHGAHLGIWGNEDKLEQSALQNGADIVIQSLHKTLPSMTQTAILHVQGSLVSNVKVKEFINIFQSSSP